MALIKSQLVLSDAMTGPLRSINKAMNLVLNSLESMQDAVGRPIDTASFDNARQELARMSQQLDEFDNQAHKTDNTLNTLLRTLGLVTIARKAFDVLKAGVDYASDLAEVQNVVDVTFGNAASTVNSWSKTTLNAYGMNEVSAKRYVGTMGAMLKSSGLAGDAIVGMSQDMVGLAGDMASFYNLDLETAFQKIRSGISGETEPLKQLLDLYNTKTRTLKLQDVLGDIRVRAGSMLVVMLGLGDLNVSNYFLVEQVKHSFGDGIHLMDLKLRGGTFVT